MDLSRYNTTSIGRIYLLFRGQFIIHNKNFFVFSIIFFSIPIISRLLGLFLYDLQTWENYAKSFLHGKALYSTIPVFLLAFAVYFYVTVNRFCNNAYKEVPIPMLLPLSNGERFFYLLLKGFLLAIVAIVIGYLSTFVCYLPVISKVPIASVFFFPTLSIGRFSDVVFVQVFICTILLVLITLLIPFYFSIRMKSAGFAILLSIATYVSVASFSLWIMKYIIKSNFLFFDIRYQEFSLGRWLSMLVLLLIVMLLFWISFRALKRKEIL